MTITTLPATQVKNQFGRVLRLVTKSGEPVVVERGGEPVAVIMSIQEYKQWQRQQSPSVEQQVLLHEAFGMWAEREDLSDKWLINGRLQWESRWKDDEEA